MSDYTFEYRQDSAVYETFEWDSVWIDHANDKDKKRVLYIGDSISGVTRKVLSRLCETSILFDGFATSKSLDNPYFTEAIALFAKQLPKTDVVLFNNGLHGWHLSDEKYGFLYEEMVRFLKEQFKDSKIFILLTTYVTNPECKELVPGRNKMAMEIAKKYDLPVIDLYSVTFENQGLIANDKIHLTEGGYELVAAKILEEIKGKPDEVQKTKADTVWNDNMAYIENVCRKVLDAITQERETEFDGIKKNEKVVLPSYNKYPSIWVRDFAMNIECGLFDAELIKKHILYFAKYGQNGKCDLQLKNKQVVPAWTVTDHLNFNGKPVYFPGTYSDTDNQGAGEYGFYPSLCDNYYFVHMVYEYIKQTGDYGILDEICSDVVLLERIEKAWIGYNIDEETELCYSRLPFYTVDWGFTDTIMKSGLLLFSSLLRYKTAVELFEIFSKQGKAEKAEYYAKHAEKVKNSIIKTFWDGSGWLYSATGLCHQYDVWGTLYAIYIGILPTEIEKTAVKTIAKAYQDGLISVHGYVRMIRTVDDDKFGQSWEAPQTYSTKQDNYQNGGYWATASGWLFYALAKADVDLAKSCIDEYVKHTKKYEAEGSPFEFINKASTYWEGKLYGTSGALTYAGAKRITEDFFK